MATNRNLCTKRSQWLTTDLSVFKSSNGLNSTKSTSFERRPLLISSCKWHAKVSGIDLLFYWSNLNLSPIDPIWSCYYYKRLICNIIIYRERNLNLGLEHILQQVAIKKLIVRNYEEQQRVEQVTQRTDVGSVNNGGQNADNALAQDSQHGSRNSNSASNRNHS